MSLRKAINAKCKECIYEAGSAGGWRQQVQACNSHKCPLFNVRPLSSTKVPRKAEVLQLKTERGQNVKKKEVSDYAQ